jgi:hypothetical protein
VSAAVADGGVVTFDLTGDDCVVGPEADGQGILLDVDCDVLDEAAPGTILDLHAWAMSGENADEATVLGSSAAVAFGYDESLAVHKTIVTSASPMPTIDMSDVHGELHEGHQVIAQFTVTAGSVDIVARRFAYGYRAQHYDPYGGDNSYGYGVGQASFSVSTDVSPGGSTIGIPGIESVWAGSTAPAAEPPYYNAPGMQTVWTAFETPRTIRAGRSETFEIVVNVVGPLTYGDQLLVTALRLDYASDDGYLQVSSQMTFVAPLGG